MCLLEKKLRLFRACELYEFSIKRSFCKRALNADPSRKNLFFLLPQLSTFYNNFLSLKLVNFVNFQGIVKFSKSAKVN